MKILKIIQLMIKNKRTEGKIKSHFGIKDYFKYFKTEYSNIAIDHNKYNSIISDFNSELINLIIEENLEYQLPFLGCTLSIKKDKRVLKIVDGKNLI